jgi:hypothetical protein
VRASSITSETFGKVAHPLPGSSTETDRKQNKKGLMIAIVYPIRVSRTFMVDPPIRGKTETACDFDYDKTV